MYILIPTATIKNFFQKDTLMWTVNQTGILKISFCSLKDSRKKENRDTKYRGNKQSKKYKISDIYLHI